MKQWKTEILKGVDVVSFPGRIPGILVVFGEKAQPILANKRGEVLCAAAELGKGRVIIFSHGMFVDSFSGFEAPRANRQFNENIRKWITRGTDKSNEIPKYDSFINNFDTLPSKVQVLSWSGDGNPGDAQILRLVDWIERGGGLICGLCSWGYVQVTGIDVSKMPLNVVLQRVGVAFAGVRTYTIYTVGSYEIHVKNNMADYAKPQDLTAELEKHPEKIDQLKEFLHNIDHLPDEVYQKHNCVVRQAIGKMYPDSNNIPTKTAPVKSPAARKAAGLLCDMMIRDGLKGHPVCADGIDEFPGSFQCTPDLQSAKIIITSTGYKYHATGHYLPAGTVMEVTCNQTKKPWKIFVGLHTDDLTNFGDELRRWPNITIKKDLETGPFKICSPFGGSVYVESPSDCNDRLELHLNNVVPAPMFTYKTAGKWESVEREKPGLWCDMIGDRISITLPAASVRHLSDPTATMKAWDSVVMAHMELRGMDASKGRGEWVVTDEQPSVGYMHAGYPIVTHLDVAEPNKTDSGCFLLNREYVVNLGSENGCWGMFHEIGHNFQDNLWTWDCTVEVTVNIFTLHAMDVICGVKPWDHPWLSRQQKKMSSFFKDGAKYETWCRDPGIALAVYAQLARDFGWKAYKSVFRTYNNLSKDKHPKSREEKENLWIEMFSNTVKKNVYPVYEFWGWPVRDCVLKKVSHYPFYFPDDETTNSYAKDRADAIIQKYNPDGYQNNTTDTAQGHGYTSEPHSGHDSTSQGTTNIGYAWRQQILQGVDVVSFPGRIPGILVVFGEKAQPILANKRGEVLCAAAELGKGRVIIFSHGMFVDSFSGFEAPRANRQFNENIRKWITRGTNKGNEIPKYDSFINNFDTLPSKVQVLSWSGDGNPGDAQILRLVDWIERGGGLICGLCSWGYVQVTGIDVAKMPLNVVLQRIGVAFAGVRTYTIDTAGSYEIHVKNNMADYAKPQDLTAELEKHPEKIDQLKEFLHNIDHLPDEVYQKHNCVVRQAIGKMCPDSNNIPTKTAPVKLPAARKAAGLLCDMMIRDGLKGHPVCADGIDEFPGSFQCTPDLQSAKTIITSTGYKYHATGYYLPAGTVMEVTCNQTKKPWKIFVGLHTDDLTNYGDELRRWPNISIKKNLETGPFKICSPFGGSVYVESPSDCNDRLELHMNNVVPAPMFTYKTAGKWESVEREKPGLWCDMIGDRISITLPAASVRHLSDPTPTMKAWDSVVMAHMELRGMDASKGRGEWVVTDEQPSVGYMHAGYPIVTHLDVAEPNKTDSGCFLLNREYVVNLGSENGCWGMFHEIGHNFQDNLWTWDCTVEVTVNIFTLHAMDVICGVKPWDHPWLSRQQKKMSSFLKDGAKYETWCRDPGIALAVYAQLARDFGWKAYKSVFRTYNNLSKDKHPKSREEKEDLWIEMFSNTVQRNVYPVYEFWGWQVRDCVLEKVSQYPFYFPDDETTKSYAKDRADAIIQKYNPDNYQNNTTDTAQGHGYTSERHSGQDTTSQGTNNTDSTWQQQPNDSSSGAQTEVQNNSVQNRPVPSSSNSSSCTCL